MTTYADLEHRLPSRSGHWGSEAFAQELSAWAAAHVGEVRSMEPAKVRVWAAVFVLETGDRRFFAKQNCDLQGFEAALVSTLAGLVPDRVVPVAAADPERGLLLTPDQGRVLGASAAEDDVDVWCRVVTAGAQLQRDVAPHVGDLAASGLTTLAPGDAPAYVERRLGELAALPADDPRALPGDEVRALEALLPSVRLWSEEVAALGLPVTLNHNDLHENNVFHVADELRFFDFADSLLTEPLGVLLIPLNMLGHRLGAGPDDARLWDVANAALEVWSDLAPLPALRAALPAALQLARLGRVESWVRCCASMSDDELTEWGSAVPQWLSTLVLDPPVGRLRAPRG